MVEQEQKKKTSTRAKVQAFGGFLTNMVLPNIGAFIAWGIVTALFIPNGWFPNARLNELVNPTIKYLLPLLLAHEGGKMVGGHRGAVLGTIGTMGLIIGAKIPMFLGAMVVGPLGGWLIKKVDKFLEDRIPVGFEMVINNFTIGIVGFLLMIASFLFIGPAIEYLNHILTIAIEALVSTGYLPLVSIINEPAKVLFLNNVIDQGVYYPLGMQQTLKAGKSVYFMLASNPGPGLGLLLAYSVFGKGAAKRTAPGAAIIHLFGGIHEMYFPYVLMKPILLIAMILGAASGIFTFQVFGAGLVAGPSPGSILAYLALTPKGNFLGVGAGVVVATVVTFLVASLILKADKSTEDDAFEESVQASQDMKTEGKAVQNAAVVQPESSNDSEQPTNYNKISFACDAGMGSSALGASVFKRKLKKLGIEDVEVKNYRIEEVPDDSDIVVVHKDLEDRMRNAQKNMRIITLTNYLQDPVIDKLADEVKDFEDKRDKS